MPPLTHASASPSAAHRWLNCTACVEAESHFQDKGSIYAEEGTLAHELAEAWINGPETHIRTKIEEFYADHPELEGSYKEMCDYLEPYIDYVNEEFSDAKHKDPGAVRMTEQRTDLSKWVPGGFGTTDVAIVAGEKLTIIDLKYGKGVPVEAKDNPQLKLYALGMYELLSDVYDIDTIKMVIYQPRLDRVSGDEMSVADLLKWGDEFVKPAAEKALNGEGEFMPGEHCQFCKARNVCKARAEMYMKLGEYKQKAFLTNSEIAEILGYVDGLVKWADGLKENVLSRALEGEEFPGWKVVEGRSNRKYAAPDDKIAEAAVKAGYDNALLWERKLLTLSAMEKLMGKKDFEKVLGKMIEKPQGKPTLAPEKDPRPSLLNTAADDFADEI